MCKCVERVIIYTYIHGRLKDKAILSKKKKIRKLCCYINIQQKVVPNNLEHISGERGKKPD